MNTKNIIWVHGTKGGIGKSLMSSVAIDYLLNKGLSPAIVESDGSVPDVHRRFGETVTSLVAPITSSESIYEMLEGLEDAGEEKNIVVNLPANAELLDKASAEIKEVTESLGYNNFTLFMIAENTDSPRLAMESITNGLASISKTAAAVINSHFGSSSDNFAWFNAENKGRKEWLKKGGKEITLPELNSRVIALSEFEKGAFTPMIQDDSPMKVVNKVILKKWLKATEEIMDELKLSNGE